MTFTNVATNRNVAVHSKKVLLKRRCLQVLTGKARYDFSHGIEKSDILSERRVSVTMRESPLTDKVVSPSDTVQTSWWKQESLSRRQVVSVIKDPILPACEPIPGLFLFPNFITAEEEATIMKELDSDTVTKWKHERHSGNHREKRFGIDHDLWSQRVRPPMSS